MSKTKVFELVLFSALICPSFVCSLSPLVTYDCEVSLDFMAILYIAIKLTNSQSVVRSRLRGLWSLSLAMTLISTKINLCLTAFGNNFN